MLQREFGQIIQRDGAGDLETLRADFVQRIIRGVPPGIIKINDIDRWNPNGVQRRVVVDEVTVQVAKVISQLQRLGRGKNIACYCGGGICGKRDAE